MRWRHVLCALTLACACAQSSGQSQPTYSIDYDFRAHSGAGVLFSTTITNTHKAATYGTLYLHANNTGQMLMVNFRSFEDADSSDGARHCELTGMVTQSSN